MAIRTLIGDCRSVLPTLPADSVHCVVTSPPYWGLRDYGTAKWEGGDPNCDHSTARSRGDDIKAGDKQGTSAGSRPNTQRECKCGARRIDSQIGLEPTFTEFIGKMVEVFREVRRVLRPDGTLWLNLGDSYASTPSGVMRSSGLQGGKATQEVFRLATAAKSVPDGLKPKDLCGIPWRVALALQADGWWLRQDIIWSKPNPMPESVTDRCTKSHEYIFLLTKSARYFYDAEAIKETSLRAGEIPGGCYATKPGDGKFVVDNRYAAGEVPSSRNKRSVWEIATSPFPEAHFATFPPALVEPCIKAGTSEKGCCAKCGAPWERVVKKSGGTTGKSWHNHSKDGEAGMSQSIDIGAVSADYKVETLGFAATCQCWTAVIPCTVLDPFGGAGTTGLVADRLQRNAILIELNPTYAAMAKKRIFNDAPLFAEAAE